eukprot:TRINITY_DN94401_c0_g1_i2.p1 TRINITY_DN94401_c0_g1~~TRINITY_DN94401_c0_g1_i2.p1  ORF type:complete len:247 (+),score=47.95 TRINITY_DN94401_c0_g1_i2:73-813(+)
MATKKAPMREDQRRVHEAAVPMGRMMIQYQRELSRCEEVFAAQLRPLETEVFDDYHEIYWKEKAIEWNNMLLAKMAERKDSFSERIDMAQERDAWLQAAQRRFVDGCSALKTVTSADLAVLRKQVNPSPMIKTCTEAVLELNGEMDTDWEAAQVILADSYFLNFFVPRACRYDIKQVSDEILQNLDDNVKNPDFQYERVMKLSTPCAAFVKWARAIYDYAMIDRIVKVKGLEMADLEAENKKAQQV